MFFPIFFSHMTLSSHIVQFIRISSLSLLPYSNSFIRFSLICLLYISFSSSYYSWTSFSFPYPLFNRSHLSKFPITNLFYFTSSSCSSCILLRPYPDPHYHKLQVSHIYKHQNCQLIVVNLIRDDIAPHRVLHLWKPICVTCYVLAMQSCF
jgi:hypothetical protein